MVCGLFRGGAADENAGAGAQSEPVPKKLLHERTNVL
jgi:hypothetical protein